MEVIKKDIGKFSCKFRMSPTTRKSVGSNCSHCVGVVGQVKDEVSALEVLLAFDVASIGAADVEFVVESSVG
jgi:hypothetical protein